MRNGWFHLEPYLIYPEDKIKKIERNPSIPEVMQTVKSTFRQVARANNAHGIGYSGMWVTN